MKTYALVTIEHQDGASPETAIEAFNDLLDWSLDPPRKIHSAVMALLGPATPIPFVVRDAQSGATLTLHVTGDPGGVEVAVLVNPATAPRATVRIDCVDNQLRIVAVGGDLRQDPTRVVLIDDVARCTGR